MASLFTHSVGNNIVRHSYYVGFLLWIARTAQNRAEHIIEKNFTR